MLKRAVTAVVGPVVYAVQRLPSPVLSVLAGRRPEIDGQRLSPGLAFLCRVSTPIVTRAFRRPSKRWRGFIDLFAGSMTWHASRGVAAADVELTGTGQTARLYEPPGIGAVAPLMVFFHGGGYATGSAAGHEGTCAFLASEAGIKILSVNYPLAPEHPSPAAHDAAAAIWRWAVDNAAALGADPASISVGGDSAGGGLAGFVALRGEPRPQSAFLLYPVTDLFADDPSVELFARGLLLNGETLANIGRHYAPEGDRDGPYQLVSAPVPADAPAFFIGVAGMDPLRDQGVRFAEHLRQGGARVELERYDDNVHGYATLLVVPECVEATRDAVAHLQPLLSGAASRASGG